MHKKKWSTVIPNETNNKRAFSGEMTIDLCYVVKNGRKYCHFDSGADYFGKMTVSITWITPLLHSTSA